MRDNGGECPSDCLGGFTYAGRKHAPELQVGEEVGLGLCEGHGAVVVLGRTEKGFYVSPRSATSSCNRPTV